MSEHRYAVQVYRTDYLCDACQTPMQYAGISKSPRLLGLPGTGTRHLHRCSGCDRSEWLEHEYPHTSYVPLPEMDFERGLERLRRAIANVDG